MEATLFFNKNKEITNEITPEEISETNQYIAYLQEVDEELQESIIQANNLDINADKSGDTTTIVVTKKDGTQKTVEILDGKDGKDGKTPQLTFSIENGNLYMEED